MVLFYETATPEGKPVVIYAGKDKVENETLIEYAWPNDIWFHVDKLSSPHVYLRLPEAMDWTAIPTNILEDISQLVKAGSILGNKKDNIKIIYTPAANLLKRGDMETGSVSFKNDQLVRRFHIAERSNAVINRLSKTKKERAVDHEAERVKRMSDEARRRRAEANERRNADLELARQRKAEATAKSYTTLHSKRGTHSDEDEEWEAKQALGDFDPDDDFM